MENHGSVEKKDKKTFRKWGDKWQKRIEKLEYLLKIKRWDPYCIPHSAITSESNYLPE
jgi:integrase/recombinase XerD